MPKRLGKRSVESRFPMAIDPWCRFVTLDEPSAKSIKDRTVFASDLLLTAGQFGLLIFSRASGDEKPQRGSSLFVAEATSESAGR